MAINFHLWFFACYLMIVQIHDQCTKFRQPFNKCLANTSSPPILPSIYTFLLMGFTHETMRNWFFENAVQVHIGIWVWILFVGGSYIDWWRRLFTVCVYLDTCCKPSVLSVWLASFSLNASMKFVFLCQKSIEEGLTHINHHYWQKSNTILGQA